MIRWIQDWTGRREWRGPIALMAAGAALVAAIVAVAVLALR